MNGAWHGLVTTVLVVVAIPLTIGWIGSGLAASRALDGNGLWVFKDTPRQQHLLWFSFAACCAALGGTIYALVRLI